MTEDSFSLVKWFRDRRTSAITNKLMEHIAKVIDVCSEYVHAVIALTSEGKPFQARKDEAEAALKRVKKTLEVLGIDDASLLNYRQEIETLEQSVDDLYFSVKKAIFAVDRPAQASLLALDILVGLENASDHCAGSAD